MRLKKAEREQVRLKYGGHCAYCGVLLGDRWHADHLAPVVRELLSKQTAAGTWKLVSGKPLRPEHDVLENMMPACAPCNISKGGQTLEALAQLDLKTRRVAEQLHPNLPPGQGIWPDRRDRRSGGVPLRKGAAAMITNLWFAYVFIYMGPRP